MQIGHYEGMAAGSGASPRGVGETALGAAMMRARESTRADPLFEDPLATAFVDAAPPVFEYGPSADDNPELATLEAAFQDAVSVRTRLFDDFVLGQVASGTRQVALLGAGLDSRACRLKWPAGVRMFELDMPDVLAFKQRRTCASARAQDPCRRSRHSALSQTGSGRSGESYCSSVMHGAPPPSRGGAGETGRRSRRGEFRALSHYRFTCPPSHRSLACRTALPLG
jgi:hypothetical protein